MNDTPYLERQRRRFSVDCGQAEGEGNEAAVREGSKDGVQQRRKGMKVEAKAKRQGARVGEGKGDQFDRRRLKRKGRGKEGEGNL